MEKGLETPKGYNGDSRKIENLGKERRSHGCGRGRMDVKAKWEIRKKMTFVNT